MSDSALASDPAKRHSAALTDGPDRAGARAMLKAIGFTDEDLAKPLVGVATTWIETMPCNYQPARAWPSTSRPASGPRAARRWSSTRSPISDGVTMGTEGMKASLISREVVADSIELVVRGHLFDGVVCLVGCDKTAARRGDGARPSRRAGPRPLQRHDLPGRLQGRAERDGRDRLRGDRGLPRRQDHPRRAVRGRERGVPRAGRLRRPVHRQHDEHGASSSSGSRRPA